MKAFQKNFDMKNIRLLAVALFLGGVLNACSYNAPEPAEDPTNPRTPPVAGNADFSKYVAIGNSITAGFMDNALYLEGQQNAYPVILAERMKFVNNNAPFNFPAFGIAGGAGFGGSFVPGTTIPVGRYQFILPTCTANPTQTRTLGLTPGPTLPGEALTTYSGNKAELNNFGVTGAKSFHALVAGYGQLNPFFGRFASSSTASMLSDAVAAKGTFFTYWLGSNDILSYALSGGSGDPNPGPGQVFGGNDITPTTFFRGTLKASIDLLLSTGNNTKGAIANIPNLVRLPFFQLVNAGLTAGGVNAPIPFSLRQGQADTLNALYSRNANAAGVNFKAGKVNYPVITTATGLRHMDPAKDFLTFLTPQDNLLAGPISTCNPAQRAGWGITTPIPNQYILDEAEAAIVSARVNEYNTVIQQEVASRNNRVALVNVNAALGALDATSNSIAPPGGLFSLDGVHPNPRGQALIANEFIRAINAAFNSTLPPVNINNYRMNTLPTP